MKPPPFANRWLIRGTLTTLTPLHVGDGAAALLSDRSRQANGQEVDAQTVCVDCDERACIPASAIKGPLRAHVKTAHSGKLPIEWEQLLGSDNPDATGAVGGKLEFYDARLANPQPAPSDGQVRNLAQLPWWSAKRHTAVAVSVSLDRRTHTAREHLLYHVEFVPESSVFDLEISAENLGRNDAQEDDTADIERILAALDTLTGESDSLTLGANESHSWGRIRWTLTEARCFTPKHLEEWLAADTQPAGYECMQHGRNRTAEFAQRTSLTVPTRNRLVFDVTLTFPGPLLIRDPQQRERADKAKPGQQRDKPPDAVPLRNSKGQPFIPAKAIRGVLGSRAEAILRTLGHPHVPEPSDRKSIRDLPAIMGRDLASQLFGTPGWRGVLRCSDFELQDGAIARELPQQFVAIDRFTGGAAVGFKFDRVAVVPCSLRGKLAVDLDRLALLGAPANEQTRGLLALLLHDLSEGDLAIGSGAATGTGICYAAVSVSDNGAATISLADWLKTDFVSNSLGALRKAHTGTIAAAHA